MFRRNFIIGMLIWGALLLLAPPVLAQETGEQPGISTRGVVFLPVVARDAAMANAPSDRAQTVCTLDVGDAGIHYAGEGQEDVAPWGPSALALGPDGRFWIADGAAARLIALDAACRVAQSIALADIAVGVADIAPAREAMWILDVSAQPAALLALGYDGTLLTRLDLSNDVAAQATGIALPDGAGPVIELQGGRRYLAVDGTGTVGAAAVESVQLQGQSYRTEIMGAPSEGAQQGRVTLGDVQVQVDVANLLGSMHILGVTDDAHTLVTVDEVAMADTVRVDETVRMYDAGGAVRGVARVPHAGQYVHVPNGLALAPSGELYFLATTPSGAEIQRLPFTSALPALLPAPSSGEAQSSGMANVGGANAVAQGGDVDAVAVDTLACVPRSDIIAQAQRFVDNKTRLTKSNIGGTCDGRTKPRYLKKPGIYASVPYDWGGFVSVDEFNAAMSQGLQAGDIQSPGVESCSVGVDCSGFVSSVWQLTSKRSTRTLPDISTPLASVSALQDGDILNKESVHTMIFAGFADNGINIYESTRSQSVDRVRYTFRSWSSLDGYTPYRYNGVCE